MSVISEVVAMPLEIQSERGQMVRYAGLPPQLQIKSERALVQTAAQKAFPAPTKLLGVNWWSKNEITAWMDLILSGRPSTTK